MIRLQHLFFIGCLWASGCCLAVAHEADEHDEDHHKPETPAAILLPNTDGPTPWSKKPVLNDPSRFQIAIVTDRTGGHRPGIWMQAVRRLNWLRPEFVVSVGDLIEGYTDERPQLNKEWNEFTGFIDQLDMKFFFVAGNHDLTNPVMHELWRKRFGPEWYSFDYKDVHFVCLCSEDPTSKLGEKQLEWVEADLAKSRAARWTLIFVHKPLWRYAANARAAGNEDATGWDRVEAALGDRPRTVFAGHHHSYVQFDENGMKYYQLGTTGGASQLRGKAYGEFDHIVWLTMEPSGPQVANVLLDGILPADTVTEDSIAHFRDFLANVQLEAVPILIDDESGFLGGRISLRLNNKFSQPVTMTGELENIPLRGVTQQPIKLRMEAKPGESSELNVDLRFTEKVAFGSLAGTTLTAALKSDGLSAERSVPIVIDRRHTIPVAVHPPKLDGDLGEWNELPFATNDKSTILQARENWQGVGDASVSFAVSHDQDFIYFAADVIDDKVTERDLLAMRLDARPLSRRMADPRIGKGSYRLRLAPPIDSRGSVVQIHEGQWGKVDAKMPAMVKRTDKGYRMEFAFPTSLLKTHQGDDWHSFQLAVVVNDFDDEQSQSSRVVWRGSAEIDYRNSGYGQFSK